MREDIKRRRKSACTDSDIGGSRTRELGGASTGLDMQ